MRITLKPHSFLIVIAATGLCAAIAWPVAGRSAQANSYFDRIAGALEAYALDHNGNYPTDGSLPPYSEVHPYFTLPPSLTTPVAYLQPQDLRDPLGSVGHVTNRLRYINFDGSFRDSTSILNQNRYPSYYAIHGSWLVWSGSIVQSPGSFLSFNPVPYDATNGAVSAGTRFRSQRLNSEIGVTSATP